MAVKINNNGVYIDGKLIAGGDNVGVLNFVNANNSTNAEVDKCYLCDVLTNSFTLTLPNNPQDNNIIQVINYKGSFKDNNLTIAGNGKKINGEDNYICKLEGSSYILQYSEENDEWICLIDSSFSLNSLFAEFMCAVPELSNQSATEIYERDYVEIDIDNYDENAEYLADNELITKIYYKSGNTFKIYFGSVNEDTDIEFRLRAIKTGYISSAWSNAINITIKDRPEEEDDAIINDAFLDNEESANNCDVTNDKITFTEDNGEYKEVVTEQGTDEEPWSSYQTLARIALDKMSIFEDDTDKDTLTVADGDIQNVSKCYITNNDFPNGKEIDIGDINIESKDTTENLDVFNDDSCIACYPLNGNSDDLSGNYNGTDTAITYDTAKYDKGAYGTTSDNSKIAIPEITFSSTDDFSISFFFKFLENESLYSAWNGETGDATRSFRIDSDGAIYLLSGDSFDAEFNADEFNHFVNVKNGSDSKCYINGELKFTGNTNDEDISIKYLTRDSGMPGCIDQFRIFNKALSDDEVSELYNEAYTKYKADISSNNLDNAPANAFFIEENIAVKTALTTDEPTDDDFNNEIMDSWSINDDINYKEIAYQKNSNYTGTKFQRKIIGDKEANIIYLKSNMWKDQ